ncbi:MAG: ABC transporter permease [Acidobacteria bacterium]|nr:ABC transporter permease [Acidobacteriota bacterium]
MPRFPGSFFLQNLVRGRSLIYQLVRRDFEQRYVGSMVGWLWGVIHPLTLLVIYTFVFQYAFGAKLNPGEVTDNYPLFLFCGMLPWMLFSETLQRAATALPEYSNLIKKSVFPSEVVALGIFLSGLVSHLLALALVVVATGVWIGEWSATLWVVPIYMILLGLLTLGLSWILGALNVYLRDTAQVLAVGLQAWFWLTPIFLPESRLGELLPGVVNWNPLAYFVRGYREAILGGRLPALSDLAILAAFGVGTFLLGGLFFRQTKRGFADVL